MSGESQLELLQRIKAEVVEARQHLCNKCNHPGSEHVFDIFNVMPGPNPCYMSCKICMDKQFPGVSDIVEAAKK